MTFPNKISGPYPPAARAADTPNTAALDPLLLRTLLDLDVETGLLFWKPRDTTLFLEGCVPAASNALAWNARYAGKRAFASVDDRGYLRGSIFGRNFRAHRIIWRMVHGDWPALIDHIDGDRLNNRPVNLRSVTARDNSGNRELHRQGSIPGVRLRDGRWEARIWVNGKYRHLGCFNSREEAADARSVALASITAMQANLPNLEHNSGCETTDGLASAHPHPFFHGGTNA